MPAIVDVYRTVLLFKLVRFQRWDELLAARLRATASR
jgi:hypothetical protein